MRRALLCLPLLIPPAFAHSPGLAPATGILQAGDTVVLNQAVDASKGARIHLQSGKVVSRTELQHREPYCYFFLNRDNAVIETPFGLTPDRFTVTGVSSGIEYGAVGAPSLRYATSVFRTQDASAENMMTRIELRSAAQPQVISLKCGIFAVPHERRHLNLGEIRGALGGLVTLELQSE